MRSSNSLLIGLSVLIPIVSAGTLLLASLLAPASAGTAAHRVGLGNLFPFAGILLLPLMGGALLRESRRRRNAQRLADKDRAELEAILASVPAAVLVSTRERVTRANPLALATLGVEGLDVLAPPSTVAERLRLRSAEDEPVSFESTIVEPGLAGRTGTAEVLARVRGFDQTFRVAFGPVPTRDGIHSVVGVFTDVTELRQRDAEQAMFAELGEALTSSLEPERLCSLVGDVLVRHFADGCVIELLDEARGGFTRLPVKTREPSVERIFEQLVAADDERPILLRDAAEATLRRPVLREGLACDVLGPSGAPRGTLAIPLLSHGKLLGTATLVRTRLPDFQEKDLGAAQELCRRVSLALDNAQLYLSAQRATAARDRLLSLVAHDLRNPLHAILLRTQTLAKQDVRSGDGQPVDPMLEGILRSARQMNRLIADLLSADQLEKGTLSMQRELLEPDTLVEQALEDLAPLSSNHRIEVEIQPGLPRVDADPARILQVFSNLLGNALKFTPAKERIRVSVHRRGADVCFQISDAGPGIAREHHGRLFQPFWQAQRDARGIGLGLWISQQIVQAHHGRIWLGPSEGSGATLCFALPTVDPIAPPARAVC